MSCASWCECGCKTPKGLTSKAPQPKGERTPLTKRDMNVLSRTIRKSGSDIKLKTGSVKASSPSLRKSGSNLRVKTDPSSVDLEKMMREYDKKFFNGKVMKAKTTVVWSRRLTSSAGNCTTGVPPKIQLSELLLKHRPIKDTKETLLHEMIHAYLSIQGDTDEFSEHSEAFLGHMDRINKATGLHITVDHDFDVEVEMYQYHWRCSKCAHVVKRGLNRPPGPSEKWFIEHQKDCGGTFVTIKEPKSKAPTSTRKRTSSKNNGCNCDNC